MKKEEPSHKKERVFCAIDAQNLFHTAARHYHGRVDYKKLKPILCKGRSAKMVVYLVADPCIRIEPFLEILQDVGYLPKVKFMRFSGEAALNTDWDEEIIKEALASKDQYDTFVLASGDGDFVPLLNELRAAGKRVEIVGFDTIDIALALQDAAHCIRYIPGDAIRPIHARAA